ncbi:MAG TPA: cytochrome c [Thermoanaerobaculia bacterium]|nr:cytochrome c [Thermoanaerobaculia bacterium]
MSFKLQVPLPIKLAATVVATTLLYTYIGQLVPQKEMLPPEETVIRTDMTTEDLVAAGEQVARNKGICLTCHTIGEGGAGLRFPDLSGIGSRAATQVEGLSELEYLAQSLYQPNVYIVPGFSPGMPEIDRPPIGLTDPEIRAVIAWLQSLGGTPTVTMETEIPFAGGG